MSGTPSTPSTPQRPPTLRRGTPIVSAAPVVLEPAVSSTSSTPVRLFRPDPNNNPTHALPIRPGTPESSQNPQGGRSHRKKRTVCHKRSSHRKLHRKSHRKSHHKRKTHRR